MTCSSARFRLSIGLTLLGMLFAASAAPRVLHASENRRTPIVRAVEQARPSVVNIHGQKTVRAETSEYGGYNADRTKRVNGMGTGVVIDERGYIITCHHVIDGVSKIQVTLHDGETYVARVVAHDQPTDLAIIKINVERKLPIINIGTSTDLMPGEPVIAVGNAYGYEHTVTEGIISALKRTVQVSDAQKYHDLIQTSASINPGNSGGPLLNIDGEMIGINVAVRVGAQGIGFAVPVDNALQIAARLMSAERHAGIWHGVTGESRYVNGKPSFVVQAVDESSPANQAGLKPGDVVTRIGKIPVVRQLDFERALIAAKPGEEVEFQAQRDSGVTRVTVLLEPTAGRRAIPGDKAWDMLGLKLAPIPSEEFRNINSRYRGGLRVEAVRADSPAAAQGIKRGDVLVGMHVWETISLDNVQYILNRSDFADLEPVKFYILRGSETLYGHLNVSIRK